MEDWDLRDGQGTTEKGIKWLTPTPPILANNLFGNRSKRSFVAISVCWSVLANHWLSTQFRSLCISSCLLGCVKGVEVFGLRFGGTLTLCPRPPTFRWSIRRQLWCMLVNMTQSYTLTISQIQTSVNRFNCVPTSDRDFWHLVKETGRGKKGVVFGGISLSVSICLS